MMDAQTTMFDTALALPHLSAPAGAQLRIETHQVHRMDGDELIVSTLKDITVSVAVVDEHDEVIRAAPAMEVAAHLIYESGQPVEQMDRHQPVMRGGSGVTLEDGVAAFKLRLNVLSSLRQNQRFRVIFTCEHGELGKLEVITSAMRTITKLHRGPREPAAAEAPPLKRKATELGGTECMLGAIEEHDREITQLRESQRAIMSELQALTETMRRVASRADVTHGQG
tara:strand:+ start:239 stop:916 length:678 start_codon:yes stop_codon:yes gene_type:complete